MLRKIEYKASDAVCAALSGLGRTEDVRFSPDNRLLAVAGYGRNRCLILGIEIAVGPAGAKISISDHMELTSDSIGNVHGIDFIDSRTMAVANRDGLVAILRLPPGELGGRQCRIEALRQLRGSRFCKMRTPGSLAVRHQANGMISLIVCNNYSHKVTRHVLDRWFYRAWRNELLLKRGLDVPDGVALSHDGRWIAVSSHNTNDIKLFDTASQLGPDADAAGVLRNANYPHGLRFTPDDRHILVADAGKPVINVYDRETGWHGSREPSRTVTVLDEETFARGSTSFEEGGPKGLDIDRSNNVVAVTCEEQNLAFFPMAAFTGNHSTAATMTGAR